MTNEYLDGRFLFPNPLSALGDFLVRFSENAVYPVLVKNIDRFNDLSTQKIIMHNKASAEFWGFKEKAMEGLVAIDLDERLPALDREAHRKRVQDTNQIVLDSGTQNTQTQIIQDYNGFVRIYQRSVTPITGQVPNRTIAVCIVSMEITNQANLLYLWNVYKTYYEKKPLAIQKLSNYLKLNRYFAEVLNCGELSTLLAMTQVERHKQVAEILHLSHKTVDSYVDAIKYKLKSNITLLMVLNELRSSRLWLPC
jgi:hypothetical protein